MTSIYNSVWSVLALLTFNIGIAAAASVEMPDFEIYRNGTASVQLSIENGADAAFDYQGFQFDLFMPAGITLEEQQLNSSLVSTNYKLSVTAYTAGTYRILAYSDEQPVNAADFITLTFKADNTVTPGTKIAQIRDVIFSAPDGQDIYLTDSDAQINIKVPAMSLTIEGDDIHTLKTTETLQLTAIVLPDDSEYKAVTWQTSSEALATVSDTGLVTAVGAGTVTITAYVTGFPEIKDEYTIEITDRLLGDANDNGTVNVADVVTIADYINHRETWQFCFVNADVDEDKEITAADIEGVLNIIKGKVPVPAKMPRLLRREMANDLIVVDDYMSRVESVQTLGLALNGNSRRFSSLQAEINLPEGMTAEGVALGNGAPNHILNCNMTDQGKVRVVIYSLDSTPFVSSEPLLTFDACAGSADTDITLDNILVSNSNVELYTLSFDGGHSGRTPSGIEAITDGDVSVYATGNFVLVRNAVGLSVDIYNVSGEIAASRRALTDTEKFCLQPGIYVVKVGEYVVKIML